MEKKSKKSLVIGLTSLFLVTLILLGLTYAYYRTRIIGNNSNEPSISVTSKKLGVSYEDGNAVLSTEGLIEPGFTATKQFSVQNTGDETTTFSIFLDNVINEFNKGINERGEYNDWKYYLYSGTEVNASNLIKEGEITTESTQYIIESVSINTEETKNYILKVEYLNLEDVDQSLDMGSKFSLRVNIGDDSVNANPFVEGTLAYNIIKNTKEKKNGTELTNAPLTSPANEINAIWGSGEFTTESVATSSLCAEYHPWLVGDTAVAAQNGSAVSSYSDALNKYVYDQCSEWIKYLESYNSATSTLTFRTEKLSVESIISQAEDDDGISYYYRGLPEDNYVTFAGMCWRIVRIDGNGNTKLILEDQDEVCSTTMNGNWDIEASDGASITMDESAPYRFGNFGYDDSSGKYKMSYLTPIDDPNRAMVNAFKFFQTNTLSNKINSIYEDKSLSDYLVSGNWCLNNKAYSDEAGTTLLENLTYTSSFYYDSYVRLYGKATKEPTLKCPVDTMETFGDNTTPMYVGTLTADEIVFAGGKAGSNNPSYYLINKWQNSNSKYFWSLSLGDFDGSCDSAFSVNRIGGLFYTGVDVSISNAVRPSVSLKSSAVISEGEGTLKKPYVIG